MKDSWRFWKLRIEIYIYIHWNCYFYCKSIDENIKSSMFSASSASNIPKPGLWKTHAFDYVSPIQMDVLPEKKQ